MSPAGNGRSTSAPHAASACAKSSTSAWTEVVAKAGEFFYVPPGHDSWVVGDEPYVSLHIMGGEKYAT
jgi:hypothetical protein